MSSNSDQPPIRHVQSTRQFMVELNQWESASGKKWSDHLADERKRQSETTQGALPLFDTSPIK